jgi:hypothetical protein
MPIARFIAVSAAIGPLLTPLFSELRKFQTCSAQLTASRFARGHLRRHCCRASTLPISARVAAITSGKLGEAAAMPRLIARADPQRKV